MPGSLRALVPAGITAALFVVRTGREDAALLAELDGYREYAREVGYRPCRRHGKGNRKAGMHML